MPVDEIQNCVKLDVSGVELRTQPVEAFLGCLSSSLPGSRGGARRAPLTPSRGAQKPRPGVAQVALSVPMEKVRALRKV
jgi:hypothetical protein